MTNLEMKLTQSVDKNGIPTKMPVHYMIAVDLEGKPISGGGGGGGGGLTNTELRASPVPMVPMLTSSGNAELSLVANTPKAFAAQACKQVTIANTTSSFGWMIQGGKKFPIFPTAYFTFFGITNLNQIQIEMPEDAILYGHWEA